MNDRSLQQDIPAVRGGRLQKYLRALTSAFNRHTHAELASARLQNELLRVTLFSIGDGVIVTGPDARVRSLNPEAERMTGWQTNEIVGKRIEEVFHIINEFTGEPVANPVEKVLRLGRGTGLDHNTLLVARDGTRIPIDDSAAPIRENGGPLHGAVLVFRDATRERTAQRAHAHLAAIVKYSGDAIVTKDLNGIVQSWNASAERLFGYRPDEIIGKSITMLLPPERLHEETEILARLRTGVPSERLETVRVTKDGRRLFVSVSISPLRDRDGEIIGASKIVHDITDRKLAEEALREATEALRESDRRKDEFLAVLSHELRNPLAPIRMAVGLLRRHKPGSADEQALRDVIERQTGQLARLLEDLLDVNRIRSGKIVLRREPMDLGEAVARAVEAVEPLFTSKHQDLVVDVPDEPVWVNADATRVTQVTANLLSNASKYTGNGGHVSVSVARDDDQALLRVRDSGIGIRADQMSHIFEMFAQGTSPIGRNEGGLGVGLAITRMLVELHGGRIDAHSDGPGCGSEFTVRMPVMLDRLARDVPGPAVPLPANRAPHHRILVADDNVDSALMLSEALEMLGHEVRTAHDGMASLAEARSFAPDVAFLDIGMPKMNGYDLSRKLRDQFGDTITLVAVTGWGQESDRRRTKEASFDHHLTKPIDLATVEKLLGQVPGHA